jgi:hypothetical protein
MVKSRFIGLFALLVATQKVHVKLQWFGVLGLITEASVRSKKSIPVSTIPGKCGDTELVLPHFNARVRQNRIELG